MVARHLRLSAALALALAVAAVAAAAAAGTKLPAAGGRAAPLARRSVCARSRALRASSAAGGWAGGWDEEADEPWAAGGAGASGAGEEQAPWERIEGCDVLLPPDSLAVRGVVHFVGGALVGVIPRQAYGALLEALAAAGYAVIATPDPQLLGFDHGAAARSVCARYADASAAIRQRYGVDELRLPVFGLGHSLGAKVLLLAGSDPDCEATLGVRRAANALLAYNNYSARRSVPLFEPLLGALRAGLQGAGAGAASALQLVKQLEGAIDGYAEGTQVAAPFRTGLRELGRLSGQLGAALSGVALAEDFTPGPAETLSQVGSRYSVSSNLVLRFSADTICESEQLARQLRARFTAPDGIGGRLAYKRLRGTHVTPNTPDLRAGAGADAGPVAAEALAAAVAELDVLIDTLLLFFDKEVQLWTPEPRSASRARAQVGPARGQLPPFL